MRAFGAVCFSLVISASAVAGTKITVHNADDANVGLNDPTPTDPIGGNLGKTLGEQPTVFSLKSRRRPSRLPSGGWYDFKL